MIWVILILIAISLLIRFDNKEAVQFSRSMMTDTWNDEYDPNVPSATHTYRITSPPQKEQNWLSATAQSYDLDSLSVHIVSTGEVTVTVRGLDAKEFIEELKLAKISAPSLD